MLDMLFLDHLGLVCPVLEEEGISKTTKRILPTGIQRRIIQILQKDEKRRHHKNIFLQRLS